MLVADTSALYALVDEDDPHHEEAKGFISDIRSLFIPSTILAETLNLIQLREGYEVAKMTADRLHTLNNATIRAPTNGELRNARSWWEEGEGSLSFADAVVVAKCEKLGCSPWTFDQALLEASDPFSPARGGSDAS